MGVLEKIDSYMMDLQFLVKEPLEDFADTVSNVLESSIGQTVENIAEHVSEKVLETYEVYVPRKIIKNGAYAEEIQFSKRNALDKSFVESTFDVVKGTWNLFTEDAPKFTGKTYHWIYDNTGLLTPAVAAIPASYIIGFTAVPVIASIVGGVVTLLDHKNRSAEDIAMGSTSLFSGICAGVGMVAGIKGVVSGGLSPRPAIRSVNIVKGSGTVLVDSPIIARSFAKIKKALTSRSQSVKESPPPAARPWEFGGGQYKGYWEGKFSKISKEAGTLIEEMRDIRNGQHVNVLKSLRSRKEALGRAYQLKHELSKMRSEPGFAPYDLPWTEGLARSSRALLGSLKKEIVFLENMPRPSFIRLVKDAVVAVGNEVRTVAVKTASNIKKLFIPSSK